MSLQEAIQRLAMECSKETGGEVEEIILSKRAYDGLAWQIRQDNMRLPGHATPWEGDIIVMHTPGGRIEIRKKEEDRVVFDRTGEIKPRLGLKGILMIKEFKAKLRDLFHTDNELEVVGRWELSHAQAAEVIAKGWPSRTVTLPLDNVHAYRDEMEALYFQSLMQGRMLHAVVTACPNKAAYEIMLVKKHTNASLRDE
jgi:hypothetical protein